MAAAQWTCKSRPGEKPGFHFVPRILFLLMLTPADDPMTKCLRPSQSLRPPANEPTGVGKRQRNSVPLCGECYRWATGITKSLLPHSEGVVASPAYKVHPFGPANSNRPRLFGCSRADRVDLVRREVRSRSASCMCLLTLKRVILRQHRSPLHPPTRDNV